MLPELSVMRSLLCFVKKEIIDKFLYKIEIFFFQISLVKFIYHTFLCKDSLWKSVVTISE